MLGGQEAMMPGSYHQLIALSYPWTLESWTPWTLHSLLIVIHSDA